MDLARLLITQEYARNWEQLPAMIDFVKLGGFFTREVLDAFANDKNLKPSPLIQLSKFEDGEIFLHDGHHRCASIWCGGRSNLNEAEYHVTNWKYSDYLDIVFTDEKNEWMGWVTPFNIKEEMRLPDFKKFKDQVFDIYWQQSPQHAKHFVLTNKHLYAKKRELHYLPELSEKFGCPLEYQRIS